MRRIVYHPWYQRNIARCMPPCSKLAPAHTHPCAGAGTSRQRRWLQNALAITHSWLLGWTNGISNFSKFSVQNSLPKQIQAADGVLVQAQPQKKIDMDLHFLGFLSLGLCLGICWPWALAFNGWLSQFTQRICSIIQICHCQAHIIFCGLHGRDMAGICAFFLNFSSRLWWGCSQTKIDQTQNLVLPESWRPGLVQIEILKHGLTFLDQDQSFWTSSSTAFLMLSLLGNVVC